MMPSSIDAAPRARSTAIATADSVPHAGPAGGSGRWRVVYVLDNLGIGGSELNAVRTAERLDRERFDVTVACFRDDGPLRQRLEGAGIPVLAFPITGLGTPSAWREGRRFTRLLAERRVDVVHSHDRYSNVFAAVCARAAGVPHLIVSKRWWHTAARWDHRLGNLAAFRLADQVLANGPSVARSLVQAERVPERKIIVVPNFVDDAAFTPLSPVVVARLRSELGLPSDASIVGCVARLSPVKGHTTLLAAFATVVAQRPAAHLVLVGDGECRRALAAQAESLGIGAHVHFAGVRPQSPNLHGLFDISVLASTSEGFPNTVIEAMAARRPVVATDVGGTPDAVEHGVTGYLTEPAAPGPMAAALLALLGSAETRERFGEAAQRLARERHAAGAIVSRLESVYATAATAARRRPIRWRVES